MLGAATYWFRRPLFSRARLRRSAALSLAKAHLLRNCCKSSIFSKIVARPTKLTISYDFAITTIVWMPQKRLFLSIVTDYDFED